MEKHLLKLPVRQREVFVLRNFDDLTYEEISGITGRSVGALKANYFHAFRKMKELMEKMDRDKLILQFIENELTPEQLRLFQEELSKSSELQSEVKKYLHLKKTTDNLKNVRLNQKYLDSIIPDFRNSFENQNRASTKRNLDMSLVCLLSQFSQC